jgi:hypothetical protein
MVSRYFLFIEQEIIYALESWAVKTAIVLLCTRQKLMYCSFGARFNVMVARLGNYTVHGYIFPMSLEMSVVV